MPTSPIGPPDPDPWDGIVSAPDGKLYGIPSSWVYVLLIDPHASASISERTLLTPFFNHY